MTTSVSVSNGGPKTVRVSGGTLGAPSDVLPGLASTFYVTEASPLVISEVPLEGGGLAGGHGEE